MKKILAIVVCLLFCDLIEAQEKRVIKENFENNTFQWDEYYEKNYSCGIRDGYLLLENKDENFIVWTSVEFPIDAEGNFEITFNLCPEKIDDETWFGILFNYEDEGNYSKFIVQEKNSRLVNRKNGEESISKKIPIILKKGKEKQVKIELIKKSKKLNFLVDDMDVLTISKEVEYNTFGCIVEGKNSLKVTEVTVEETIEQ